MKSLLRNTKATSNSSNIPLGNALPIASCVVTIAADHQTERTLSPGTCAPAKCNNQPGIQCSDVHPTASSALSHGRTLVFGLRLHHLNTNNIFKILFLRLDFKTRFRESIGHLLGFDSVMVWVHSDRKFNWVSHLKLAAVQLTDNGTWKQHLTAYLC